MNKKLIKYSLSSPTVAKALFDEVTNIHGELTPVEFSNEDRRTTFHDSTGSLYSTMTFGFVGDAMSYIKYSSLSAWTEKVVVIATSECWRGNFTIVRYRGTTKICIVNLGGVVSRARNYGYREMALLCQGAIFSPMTDLGIEISKIMEDTKDDGKSKRYA